MVRLNDGFTWSLHGPAARSPAGAGVARVFGCAMGACLALGASAASGADCSKAVQMRLQEMRVDLSEVTDQRLVPRRDMHKRIVAYNAWFWFQSCTGNLVVQLNRYCQVRQTYWRGDCPGDADKGGTQ